MHKKLEDEGPLFFKALKLVIRNRMKSPRRITFEDLVHRTGLPKPSISQMLSEDGKISLDDLALIASAINQTTSVLIESAKKYKLPPKVVEVPVAQALETAVRENPIQVAVKRAQRSNRTLGLHFLRKDDPVVDRDNPIELQRVKKERERRKKESEQVKALLRR